MIRFAVGLTCLAFAVCKVEEINAQQLSEATEFRDYVLVEFYTDWCVHCKEIQHLLDQVENTAIEDNLDLLVVKIDGEKNIQLIEAFEIEAFPTFAVFFEGSPIFYNGKIAGQELYDWAKGVTTRTIGYIKKKDHIITLSDSLRYIHIFTGKKNTFYFTKVLVAAKSIGDVPIFRATSPEILSAFSLKRNGFYTLDIASNSTQIYNGKRSPDLLIKFVYATRLGYLLSYSDSVIAKLFLHRIPSIFIFEREGDIELEIILEGLKDVYFGYMVAVKISNFWGKTESSFLHFCELESQLKGVCIVERDQGFRRYKLQGDYTPNNIEELIERYLTGNLQPHYLHEHIGEEITNNIRVSCASKART